MQITLGKVTKTKARFKGDKLVYKHADLLVDGKKIGSVHQSGYAPRWAYNITQYRWQPANARYLDLTSDHRSLFVGLLFDGAAFDTAEIARAKVESQLSRFEELKAANPR